MTQLVNLPDGSQGSFPDDMPDEQIAAVIKQQFGGGPPQPPIPANTSAGDSAGAAPPILPQPAPATSTGAAILGNRSGQRTGMSVPRVLEGVGGAVTQGFTGNFGDEMLAGLESKITGGNYGDKLKNERTRMKEFSGEHPWLATSGEVLGGMASPIFRLGGGLLGLTTGGAITGAGSGEDAKDRAWSAGVGAAMGPVFHYGANAIGAGAKYLKNLIAGPNAEKSAYGQLVRSLMRDDPTATPADAIQNAVATARSHPERTLADTGRNTGRLARTVETVPSAGSETLVSNLANRQVESSGRVGRVLRGTVSPNNANNTIDDLINKRSAEAAPDFARAFRHGPIDDQHINYLLEQPEVKEGLQRGMQSERLLAAGENRPFNTHDHNIVGTNPDGSFIFNSTPNLRMLHTAKKGLDDILEESRNDLTGRLDLDNHGRSILSARTGLDKRMKQLVPDYETAVDKFAGRSASIDAVHKGRRFMRGDAEDQFRIVNNLSPGDRDFFIEGVAREMRKMVESNVSNMTDVTRKVMAPEVRRRLQTVLGPSDFTRFEAAMRHEQTMARTFGNVTGNSVTGRIAAEQADASSSGTKGLEFMLDMASGGPVRASASFLRRHANKASGMDEATADILGDVLSTKSHGGLGLLEADLLRHVRRQRTQQTLARAAKAGLLSGSFDVLSR